MRIRGRQVRDVKIKLKRREYKDECWKYKDWIRWDLVWIKMKKRVRMIFKDLKFLFLLGNIGLQFIITDFILNFLLKTVHNYMD